jgi:hypothetical protein
MYVEFCCNHAFGPKRTLGIFGQRYVGGFWTFDDYCDPVANSLPASCEHFIAVCESTVDYVDFPNASCCIVEAIANHEAFWHHSNTFRFAVVLFSLTEGESERERSGNPLPLPPPPPLLTLPATPRVC